MPSVWNWPSRAASRASEICMDRALDQAVSRGRWVRIGHEKQLLATSGTLATKIEPT